MTPQKEKLASLKCENAQLRLLIATEQASLAQKVEIAELETGNAELRAQLRRLRKANGTA